MDPSVIFGSIAIGNIFLGLEILYNSVCPYEYLSDCQSVCQGIFVSEFYLGHDLFKAEKNLHNEIDICYGKIDI